MLRGLICAAGVFLPTVLQAQSAVEERVDALIAFAEKGDETVTVGSREVAGEVVVLKEVTFSDGQGNSLEVDSLRFSLEGDLTRVEVSPKMTIRFVDAKDGPIAMSVTSDGLTVLTNQLVDDPAALTAHHIEVAARTLRIGDFVAEKLPFSEYAITQTGLTLVIDVDVSEHTTKFVWHADNLDAVIAGVNPNSEIPDMPAKFDMRAKQQGWDISASFDLPPGPLDENSFLSGQHSAEIQMSVASSTGDFYMEDPDFTGTMSGTVTDYLVTASANSGNLIYKFGIGPSDITLAPSDMPQPIPMGWKSVLVDVNLPFGTTGSVTTSRVIAHVKDLFVGEAIWSMFDPAGTLSRAPANLDFELSLNAEFAEDFLKKFDIAPKDAMTLIDASLSKLFLSVGGATISAAGDVIFDDDPALPLPSGKIEVALDGAMTLAEKLAALGLIGPRETAMLTSVLGIYAKSTGADSYTSDVLLNGAEPPTINGQPLPF